MLKFNLHFENKIKYKLRSTDFKNHYNLKIKTNISKEIFYIFLLQLTLTIITCNR